MTDTDVPIRHLCCLTHRGDRLPEVHPPAYCCDHHVRQLRHQVTDIRRLWEMLPDIGLSARDGAGRCGANSTPPVRLDILAITDVHSHVGDDGIPPAAAQLTEWAALVADERHLTPAATPDAALALLAVHLDHVTCQPWVADFAAELRRIHHALRHLAGETRSIVGTCHADDPDPQVDGECGGPLVHQPVGDVAVVCLRCGDSWSQGGIDLALAQMSMIDEREQDAG